MGESKRRPDGTFRKGVSGNPAGRPLKQRPRHRFPVHNASAAIDVAETLVNVTIDGDVRETSVYNAVMLKLATLAMNGDRASARLFLQHADAAAATRQGYSELVRMLVSREPEEQKALEMLQKYFPDQDGGTYYELPDGTTMPARWFNVLQRMENLDAREQSLTAQQRKLSDLQAELRIQEERLKRGFQP